MASPCVLFSGPIEAAGGWPMGVGVMPSALGAGALADAARDAPYREAEGVVSAHAAHVRLESPQTDGPALGRLEALTRAAGVLLPLPGALAVVCEEGAA